MRLRLAQLLMPFVVLAKRFPNLFAVLLAFGAQALTLALLAFAARRFGWQRLAFKSGSMISWADVRLDRHVVHRWTFGALSQRTT